MEACTIVARNYLPYARVFAQSLALVHPESRITVLVIDGAAEASDRKLFRSLALDDVIPDPAERQRLAIIYDVTELSTAVKPFLLRRLLKEGAPSVLYFDPDVQVFNSLESLWELATAHGIALTPHVLAPIPDDGFGISDLAILRAGIYNLGFIGVGAGSESFLDWWSERLRRHCISDPDNGIFVDQRWTDYVPALFPHVVVRDPGCNVAYWNLHERSVACSANGLSVNGRPLRFFHFSGFDPAIPHLLSRHQGQNPRILLSEHPIVRELCQRYTDKVRTCGHSPMAVDYGFSTLPDGTPVDHVIRRLYRQALLEGERSGRPLPPLPFEGDHLVSWLNAPSAEAPRLSRYLFALHQHRVDLQGAFPRLHGGGAEAYLWWVKTDPWAAKTIPPSLRPPANDVAAERPYSPPSRNGINVAGYFKAELGVGEVARLVMSAARSDGIPVAAILNDRTLSRQQDGFELGEMGTPYGVTLICANADSLPRAVDALPRAMIDGCHRIGFWFWETEELPRGYQPASELIDEVWAASEYVATAIRRTVSKPVRVCPLPVRPPDPAPASKADLGLPEGFVFLFVFDFLSIPQRKNPTGLIEAFCRAFRPGEGPTLVLKSINGQLARAAFDAVRAAAGGRPDVLVMDGYLTCQNRDALMSLCDCYISLHRSEGFGLTLAEAMALGKPTIATAYSGNMTFMTPENSFLVPWRPAVVPSGCEPYPEGDRWAEPDLAAASSLMRSVYENPALARERGRRGRADVMERLSPARTAAFLRERLAEIAQARLFPEAQPATGPAARPIMHAFAQELEAAQRAAAEAERMLADGIPYAAESTFGWPGRVLRSAVLRLLRPYAFFEVRVHQHHLRSTAQVLECLRALDGDAGVREQRVRNP